MPNTVHISFIEILYDRDVHITYITVRFEKNWRFSPCFFFRQQLRQEWVHQHSGLHPAGWDGIFGKRPKLAENLEI